MDTAQERVMKIFAEQLGVKDEEVTPDKSFIDDLGADYMEDVNALTDALEEEFQIEIPDQDSDRLTMSTVQAAIDYAKIRRQS
ncbi:acyl carrier protein [Streptomyces sp. NPDC008163]|uniref:acyl carrier protein n=1 Tax=Streptomyces sp. NPDC008163 TaxID=3364818 RepID=UPI0036ED5DAB